MAPVQLAAADPRSLSSSETARPGSVRRPEFTEQVRSIQAQLPSVRTFIATEGGARAGWTCKLARRPEQRRSEGADRSKRYRDPALYFRHHRKTKRRDAVARELPVRSSGRRRASGGLE